jgi:hypothetical protein
MKKLIYFIAITGLLLSSCKVKEKKPFFDTVHIAGTLIDTEQVIENNTINLYGAKRKIIRKTKCKVKWKNCFLHKKKYSKTEKDSLMKLHVQLRKKVLTSPFVVIENKAGKKINVFVDEVEYEQIKSFQNANKDRKISLMFQGILLTENQLKAREMTSIFIDR